MRSRLDRWRTAHPSLDVAVLVRERFVELHGGMMASAVTLSFFISLFPLLLVTSAVVGQLAVGHDDFAANVVDRLGLTGTAAQSVTNAITTASTSRRVASVVGIVGLLWTGLGAAVAMSIVIDQTWQVKGRGLRDRATGFVWLIGAAIGIGAAAMITSLLVSYAERELVVVGLVASTALLTVLFVWTFRTLGSPSVGWRAHLPGAVAAAFGFHVLSSLGGLVLPLLIGRSSALYGSIGAVFGILAWFLVFGRLFVYAVVLNVVLYEREHGTVTAEIEVPNVGGAPPSTVSRSGEVDERDD